MSGERPEVVMVGAGFGGLAVADALRRAPVEVTVVDQHNYHLFTPFLYQVATALLEPDGAASPIRAKLRRLGNVSFRLATVDGVDLAAKVVHTDAGNLGYDYLVLAAGAVNAYFGHPDIAERSFGLNDLPEALQLRDHILARFEAAAWTTDRSERGRLLSFAVVGGGPTGVEFAGALAELVAGTLAKDFPRLDPAEVSIVLAEGSDEPLAAFPAPLPGAGKARLESKGVHVRSGAMVSEVHETGLHLKDGGVIPAATVIWAAGVRASHLTDNLGLEVGSHQRIKVGSSLQVPGHPEMFAIGDVAEIPQERGSLPTLAQVAIQSGRHAGEGIEALVAGRQPGPFRYRNLGTRATVGRDFAVAEIGPVRLSGMLGCLSWLFLHIARIAGVRTRWQVLTDWTSGYLFRDRPVRLIIGSGGAARTCPGPGSERATGEGAPDAGKPSCPHAGGGSAMPPQGISSC